jgi:TRAP-type C4-dicarboxylate transport system permease small subunit
MATHQALPRPTNAPARWYVRTMEALGASMMLIIVVVMAVQVLTRYAFNSSLIWAEELCRYLLIWMSFLMIGLALQRGELVAVDLVTGALPPRWRFGLKVLASIPVIIFLGVLVYYGATFATRMSVQTLPAFDFIYSAIAGGEDTADISVFWVYISVPLGCALLIVHILISLWLEARILAGQTAASAMAAH